MVSYRDRINREIDELNAAAAEWNERDEMRIFDDAFSSFRERDRKAAAAEAFRQKQEILERARQAELEQPNPYIRAILNSPKKLQYDEANEELIVDGVRIAAKELQKSGATKALEKLYRDAIATGIGVAVVSPEEMYKGPVSTEPEKPKPKKTALLDYVELDL